MAAEANRNIFVFNKAAVLRSIARLVKQPIHEHFAGYLSILRARRANGNVPARSKDIVEFHDRYLRVVGAPDGAPYVRPFRSRGEGLQSFRKNVAGSYAPSSLRAETKFRDVVHVNGVGKDARYDVFEGHATLALKHFLNNKPVPVSALATFIYRDYGVELEKPDFFDVMQIFRDEFGLRADLEEEQQVYSTIFEDDVSQFGSSDLERFMVSSNG